MSRVIVSKTTTAIKGPEFDWKFMPKNSTEENALYKYAFKLVGEEYLAKVVVLNLPEGKPVKLDMDFYIFSEKNKGTNTNKKHIEQSLVVSADSKIKGKTLRVDMPRGGNYKRHLTVNVTMDDKHVSNRYNLDIDAEQFHISEKERAAAKKEGDRIKNLMSGAKGQD